jgi:hypothetical protein
MIGAFPISALVPSGAEEKLSLFEVLFWKKPPPAPDPLPDLTPVIRRLTWVEDQVRQIKAHLHMEGKT